jgi:hypothetical protein
MGEESKVDKNSMEKHERKRPLETPSVDERM